MNHLYDDGPPVEARPDPGVLFRLVSHPCRSRCRAIYDVTGDHEVVEIESFGHWHRVTWNSLRAAARSAESGPFGWRAID